MTVLNTPAQIALYQVATWKAVLRLEKAGMKGRGGAIRPKIAAQLGLKPKDSYDVFIAKCVEMIEAGLKD